MNLADVMDQIAARLNTITDLRTFAYPPGTVTPPAAIVSFPSRYTPGESYGRGMARMDLPVVIVVGTPTQRQTRDRLARYCNGAGTDSVTAVLESGTYTAFDSLRVGGITFDVVPIGATDHMAAVFELEIVGQGT